MQFYKYHGTGNDFIMIDSYNENIELSKNEIKSLCNRRFGIGSDGLMLVRKHLKYDFEMDYYNPDGSGATFCGNGARCIVAFAKKLGIINYKTEFIASDGVHKAFINNNIVKLEMKNIDSFLQKDDYIFMNTGSPHVVKFCNNLDSYNVQEEGSIIRYKADFNPVGTNVNFVEQKNNYLQVRTYEKGVENETFSCGTGVVASALSFSINATISGHSINNNIVNIKTKGGNLKVYFDKNNDKFTNIWLEGAATFVYQGTFTMNSYQLSVISKQ